jgi:hypothetical protein
MRIAEQYCDVMRYRSECSDDLVVGRYSVLPYYKELEYDIPGRLVNSYQQHKWIADFEYYSILKDFTFPSWTDEDFYRSDDGPFVLKGKTNSRKHQWNTHMFAENKDSALKLSSELYNDPLIGSQGVIYRRYIPLETFEEGLNGLNFTNEWRFFFYKRKILAKGYYWSQAEKAEQYNAKVPDEAIRFASMLAEVIACFVPFYVIDIAKTQSGEWIMVELNDGQMSGLGMCNPHDLYKNISNEII